MKAKLLGVLLAASFAAPAAAGDNATLAVSAQVSGTCRFTTNNFTMDFGTLDPAAAADQSQVTGISYRCTKNTAASSITFDGDGTSPASVNISNGTDSIPVALSWTLPATLGSGFGAGSTAITMNVTGDILGTNYANVSAGSYTRNVAVVVAP
jgi:hypothetical protein